MPSDQPPLTESELADIERRYQAATPGPWKWTDEAYMAAASVRQVGTASDKLAAFLHADSTADGCSRFVQGCRNAEFSAHARQDVPTLVDSLRKLRAEVERLQQRVTEYEVEMSEVVVPELADGVEYVRILEDGSKAPVMRGDPKLHGFIAKLLLDGKAVQDEVLELRQRLAKHGEI